MTSPHTKPDSLPPQRARLTLVPRPELTSAYSSPACSTPVSSWPVAWFLDRWHLLSLDAPSVAATWTLFIARSAGIRLPWIAPVAMFVAVWMLYAADRLLDARPLLHGQDATGLEERHRFHHRYRNRFLTMMFPAAIFLAWLLHHSDLHALHLYTLLAVLLAAWLLLVHARPIETHRLPKEIAVGIFFPAAVFIPTVARAPYLRLTLLPIAIMFAAVCMLNCLFLYRWEHSGELPEAHLTTLWATQRLVPLGIIALVLSLALGLLPMEPLHEPFFACAASIGLLLWLHSHHREIHPVSLRAAADLVLLSPLPLFLVYWIR